MKIIFFGTPHFVVPVLEELAKSHEIAAVVTAPDKKVGRKQIITPSPVNVFAQEQDIKILQPESFKDFSLSEIEELEPDLIITAAYGKLVPNAILGIPQYGALNIHPSLLPKYRGSSPIQQSILDGEKDSGITIIKMDAEMDHGPILHQIPYKLTATDTADHLMKNMFAQAAIVLPSVVDNYTSGKLTPVTQEDSQATYTKIITKQDGFIDLGNPPEPDKLDRMIRAYYSWPTVWTSVTVNDRDVRIKFLPKQQIQMEGKQPVSLKDFLNGYPDLKQKIVMLFKPIT